MSTFSMRRWAALAAGTIAGVVASALPASALTLGLGGTSLLHVADCRSVALARQANYGFDFSSKSTGPQHVRAGLAADASIEICYSLDVLSGSSFSVTTDTLISANALVNSLLTQTDASKVCTALHFKALPGVKGTVSVSSHAHLLVDGLPPLDWDHEYVQDFALPSIGEDITLKMCADTSGNVTAS
jgi:hypothetical protein